MHYSVLKYSAKEIRGSKKLSSDFFALYAATFGNLNGCLGCQFESSYIKLKNHLSTINTNIVMKNTDSTHYELIKKQGVILWFIKDGRKHRRYDYKADQSFLKDYLTYGTDEQLEARKLEFRRIPESEVEVDEEESEIKVFVHETEIEAVNIQPKKTAKKPTTRKKK